MAASIPTTEQSFEPASRRQAHFWLSRSNNSIRLWPHVQVNASFLAFDALDLLLQLSNEENDKES